MEYTGSYGPPEAILVCLVCSTYWHKYVHARFGSMDAAPDAKRARIDEPEKTEEVGTMPKDLRETIEKALGALGEVEHKKRSRKKGAEPVRPKCRPNEDLTHESTETKLFALASPIESIKSAAMPSAPN